MDGSGPEEEWCSIDGGRAWQGNFDGRYSTGEWNRLMSLRLKRFKS